MEKINITIGNNIYPYYLYENIKDLAIAMEKETRKHSNSILIYDSNIPRSCIDKLLIKCTTNSRISVVEYRISEDLKNMLTVNNVLDLFIKYKADRKTGIFVIGGGVLGNIVGLACGLLYRGISLIHIPSTLIACADSVLSLKQGINKAKSKNIIGMYYTPDLVMICPELYESLSMRDRVAGYVELVKNLVIAIPEEITSFLQTSLNLEDLSYDTIVNLVRLSIKAKLKLIVNDEQEKNKGILLEYGHTIGHALEMFFPNEIRHGEGVAVGMLVAAKLSMEMNLFTEEEVATLYAMLKKVNVFVFLHKIREAHSNVDIGELASLLKMDNKRGYILCQNDEIAMVIMKHFGQPLQYKKELVVPVKLNYILKWLQRIWEKEL